MQNGSPYYPVLPLLLASILLLAALIVPKLRRWPLWVGAVTAIAAFGALTFLVQKAIVSPLTPHFSAASSGQRFWEQLIEASWWWAAARVVIYLSRLVVVLENRPRETRIVSDLVAGAISVATLLAIINFAFEVPIRGLLATSGVIAIVLGLALQSTLSDVFSGIAVGLERPYSAGDLLWVEGGIEGNVVQINWRSTQIMTGDNNIAIVPNSIIAKARLINRSTPTPIRSSTVTVALDAAASMERSLRILTAAARSCRVMLAHPLPAIACTEIRGDGTVWEIGFSVASSSTLTAARTELLTQLHRHLRHAGIALAVTGLATPAVVKPPTLSQLLAQSDLFGVVAETEREQLIPYFELKFMAPGDILIRQGDIADAMFLIMSGTAEVTVAAPAGPRVVHRMSPGESLGAIGLINGSPSPATATAVTEMQAYRIGRAELSAAIKQNPKMAGALEELARRGQAALRREAEAFEQSEPVQPEMFLGRLRNLLHALGS